MTTAAAAALVAENLYHSLSRWIGPDGCHALFARARGEAVVTDVSLSALSLQARAVPYLEGVATAMLEYGDRATADAIEAMLIGVSDLLGRLIGVDMANSLVEQALPDATEGDAVAQKRSAEA